MEHCMVWCKHGCCALSRRVSSSFCWQGIPGNYHNCRSPPRRRRGVLRFWQRVKPSLRGHGDIRISHTNDSLPECCNIAITLITPALPLTKKSQIALHLKRAHDGVPCDQTKGRNSQDLWIGVLRCGGKISCREGTKLSERSGTLADDPFRGRHPTSHERRSVFPRGSTPDGIADLAGNVLEWVADWYDESEKFGVVRGGSWYYNSSVQRASCRDRVRPGVRNGFIGFRCAREVFP